MIAHWDIIQGTEDWHKIRYGKIGGSTSKGLLVDSDTLLDEILSSRLEAFELDDDSYVNSDMARGNELEPLARQRVSEYTGLDFLECGWLQCEDVSILGISPDGITKDLRFACEIKCPSAKKHTNTIRAGVTPLDHVNQVVHNFTVNPTLEVLYFVSFRPESKYPLFVTKTDRETKINLGTKAKPVIKTVNEWVAIIRGKAIELETKANNALLQLEF